MCNISRCIIICFRLFYYLCLPYQIFFLTVSSTFVIFIFFVGFYYFQIMFPCFLFLYFWVTVSLFSAYVFLYVLDTYLTDLEHSSSKYLNTQGHAITVWILVLFHGIFMKFFNPKNIFIALGDKDIITEVWLIIIYLSIYNSKHIPKTTTFDFHSQQHQKTNVETFWSRQTSYQNHYISYIPY